MRTIYYDNVPFDDGRVVTVEKDEIPSGSDIDPYLVTVSTSGRKIVQYRAYDQLFCFWATLVYEPYKQNPVCIEWKKDFYAFKAWAIENGYPMADKEEEMELAVKDKSKPYSPENCYWVWKGHRHRWKKK